MAKLSKRPRELRVSTVAILERLALAEADRQVAAQRQFHEVNEIMARLPYRRGLRGVSPGQQALEMMKRLGPQISWP